MQSIENYRIQMSKQKGFPKIDKQVIKEITNQSKNALAGRLFRNSSLGQINPNISMLSSSEQDYEPSFLNSSASSSQLVASISLRKLKNKLQNDRYPKLEISNGKLLIKKSSMLNDTLNKDSPRAKHLFKKLDKLTHQPMNRILPNDLIDFPIENELEGERKILKKAAMSPFGKPKKHKFMDDKEDLLPQDFIQLLENQKSITNQFCYLKKMNHPYDLKIIQFDKNLQRKSENDPIQYPSQYITISSRGVTYFSEDQSRFVSLSEWKREASYFKKIIKLDFFKNFKVIKNFSNWKKCLRKSAMNSTKEKLEQALVYNDLFLSKSLLKIREICYIMETDVSYCRLDECQQVLDIDSYKQSHLVFLEHHFQKKITDLQQNIKEVLMSNMSLSMKWFKEENKISSSIEGKGMPLLIGDEKNLQMPYTKEATLRTQQEKFLKYIKLVDLIITHSKVNMMSESTTVLVKKIEEENQNYQRQVVNNNYKNTFKGKQYLQCVLTLNHKEQDLFLQPTKQDLKSLFETIVTRSVIRICKNHKKINADIDVLSIIYDSQEQFPKESESETLKLIMNSDNREEIMLKSIMDTLSVSYNYILTYVGNFKGLTKTYYENEQKFQQIFTFQAKDYETISLYLQEWQKQKQAISKIGNEHQGPVLEVSLKKFKQEVERKTDECIKEIKLIIPKIFEESIKELSACLRNARSAVENKPTGIKQLIVFNQNLNQITIDIEQYSERMAEITCLQILMRNITPSSSESNYKKLSSETKDLQSSLNKLRDEIDKAEKENKKREGLAQDEVKKMVPQNKQRLTQLYAEVERLAGEEMDACKMLRKIQYQRNELTDIMKQLEDIKTYQRFLSLEQSTTSQIQNFDEFFTIFERIWKIVKQFDRYFHDLQEKPSCEISVNDVNIKVEQFITTAICLEKQIKLLKQKDFPFHFSSQDSLVLKQMMQKIQQLKPLIETIECLMDSALGQKQWKQILGALQHRNPKLKQMLEVDRLTKKPKDLIVVSASSQLPYFKGVVAKAKKSNQISHKLESIKSSKLNQGFFKNLTEKFKENSEIFLEQLDEKIIIANFVIEESENYENEKAKSEKIILEKLKQIILLWEKYEQHVQYFQPVYLLTDWKNTSEGKLFISATQQNWKKTYKSFKDSNLSKIYAAQKILIASLKESNDVLESLYPGVCSYFNTKRLQCPKFCFLSDSEIIKIFEQSKDFKGLNNYINVVFPTLKQLVIKEGEVIPCEVINLDGEILPIKTTKNSNEVEQILKIVEESIKSGIRQCVKSCEKGYKSEQFNRVSWIKENLTQVLVLVSNMFFTHIIESDYLTPESYDIDQLLTYHESQIKSLKKASQEKSDSSFYKKMLVLLAQSICFRDIILELKLLNIKSPDSYSWLKHIRTSYECEPVQIEYLNVSIPYGNEFVCMESNPLLITTLSEKAIVQTVNSMVGCNNVPIVCKSYLSELAIYNAKPYNSICLISGQETRLVQATIEGTWLSGSFTDFTLSKNISIDQLRLCARLFQQIQLTISLKDSHVNGLKSTSFCKEAGICIISKDLISSPLLRQCKFDYRIVSLPEVPWNAYLSLLLSVNNLQIPDFAEKLSKIIVYLENCIKNFELSRQDVKVWIEQAVQESQNQTYIVKTILKRILKIYGNQFNKKIINKLFVEFFGMSSYEKLLSHKSIRDCQGSDQEINKIISSLKDNKVCVLSGQNSEFKQLIIQSVRKSFSSTEPRYIIMKQENISKLFGSFHKGKWVDNLIAKRIKQSFNSRQCFVIFGNCSQLTLSILQRLNSSNNKNNFLNLENGSQIRLGENQKIIFVTQSNVKDLTFNNFTIGLFDLSSIKSIPEEIFDYLTKIKTNHQGRTLEKRFFTDNHESLNRLHNLFLNNIEKISSSSLKMIGYKSDYNQICLIMDRFVLLLGSVLEKDKQKVCVNNYKMMEKLYVWCLYWAIASNMPHRCIQRMDKLFDSIKIEYDKSQPLIESKFSIFESNLTVYKFIKGSRIFKNQNQSNLLISPELEAKKQLIKTLISINSSIMILGQKNSGKSTFVDYLTMTFQNEGFTTVKTRVTQNTTAELFMEWLKPSIYLQSTWKQNVKHGRISSANGKKLIIFVDNFNLLDISSTLYNFFESAISFQYIYDVKQEAKIVLDNVCFVFIKNSCFESIEINHSFMLRKIFPVYVNENEFSEIMNVYAEDLDSIEEQDKKQLLGKILPSIATLHQFSSNLMTFEKSNSERFLSHQIPIWIAKELIRQARTAGTTCNDLITLWKFLSLKKYIASGLLYEFVDQFTNQLSNIVSLVVKISPDSETALKQERSIVSQLFRKLPLLKLKFDQTDYYTYMIYLLRSDQLKHLISHSRYTSAAVKAKALKFICECLSIKFQYPKNCLELSNLRNDCNMLIYVDGTNKDLVQSAFAAIVEQSHSNQITFIIDLDSEADFLDYLRFNPNVDGLAHIYSVDPVNSVESFTTTNYYQQIDDLLALSDICDQKQQADLFYLISEKAAETEQKVQRALKSRSKALQNSISNFNSLKILANQSSQEIKALSEQIESLSKSEENLQESKAELSDALSALKRKADGNPQEKQSLSKKLSSIDSQLKKIKNTKNDKSQTVARLKQANTDKIESTKILCEFNQLFEKDREICSCLLKQQCKYNYFQVMYALLTLRQSNHSMSIMFDRIADLAVHKIGFTLTQVFTAIIGVKLTNPIQQRFLIQWVLSSFELAFATNNIDGLIHRLQVANPESRLCLTQYDVSQCTDSRPIIAREQLLAKGPKASLVCSLASQPQRPFVRVVFNNKVQVTLNKIESIMSEALGLKEKYELDALRNQLKRFEIERQSLKCRLIQKTLTEKTVFLSSNNLSDVKQIADATKALNTRLMESKQKINSLEQILNESFGKIDIVVKSLLEYLAFIAQRFSYMSQNQELMISLVSSALVFEQPEADSQQDCPGPKYLNEPETIRNILTRCAKWMSLSLTPRDFIFGMFVLSCVKLTLNEQISKQCLQLVYRKLDNLQAVCQQQLAIISHQTVRLVLSTMQAAKPDLFLMLQSSSAILELDLTHLIKVKEQWFTGLRETFSASFDCPEKESHEKRVFLMLGSLKFNSYKLIDSEIRKQLNGDQSIIYLNGEEDLGHRIEQLEKTPVNAQGWLVLKNWGEPSRINRLLAYTQNKKTFKTVIFFDSMQQFKKAKVKLDSQNYYQICLHDQTKSICHQVKELFKIYSLESTRGKQNPNVSKLLKYVIADQISKICKGIVQPQFRLNSFDFKVFESWLQRATVFSLPDFILYTLDYIYEATNVTKESQAGYLISIDQTISSDLHTINKSRTFLRECKKLLLPRDEKRKRAEQIQPKQEGIACEQKHKEIYNEEDYIRAFDIDVYEYPGTCQLYTLFSQSLQALKTKINREDSLKKLMENFLPYDLKESITVDMLLGLEQHQKETKIVRVEREKMHLTRKQALQKLNKILQSNQAIINKQQQGDKFTTLVCQILKSTKRNIEFSYSTYVQKIKKLTKVLQSNLNLSKRTEEQLLSILRLCDKSLTQMLSQMHNNMAAIQKQIELKDINLGDCLMLVNQPKQFFYTYILELTSVKKLVYTHSKLQLKCLTEKQKEVGLRELNKYQTLANVRIVNGKIDVHKFCVLETIEPGEMSKPISIVLNSKEEIHSNHRLVPLIVNGINVAVICMATEAKQLGFWSCEVSAVIADKDEPDKQLRQTKSKQNK